MMMYKICIKLLAGTSPYLPCFTQNFLTLPIRESVYSYFKVLFNNFLSIHYFLNYLNKIMFLVVNKIKIKTCESCLP